MIRAVLFDLDDTLFDHGYTARTALGQVRSAHACLTHMDAGSFERCHATILEELHAQVMTGKIELDVARRERFKRLFAAAGVDVDDTVAAAAAAEYRRHYLASRRSVPGAATLLEAARTRARVGIVSNNLLEEQLEKLRFCGLDRHVDALVVSEEVKVSKPDPRIFEVALARLACGREEAVMVGDSWSADIAGALAAGIRAVWFDRRGAGAPPAALDVSVITSLEPAHEVLEVIFGRGGTGRA